MPAPSLPPPAMLPLLAPAPTRREQTRAGLDLAKKGLDESFGRLTTRFREAKAALGNDHAGPARSALDLMEDEARQFAALAKATAATLGNLQRGRKR